ncbi:hypothetical protein HWV62_28086 [Athelia sp. TMB]|nr:hypothetical protein HWV62_28086 [Athelia sp. TMB]
MKSLKEISVFTQQQASQNFLKMLFVKEKRIAQIDAYNREIAQCITVFEVLKTLNCPGRQHFAEDVFQIASLVHIQDWQSKSEKARIADQKALDRRLDELETNQHNLFKILNAQQSNMMAMMVSLQKRLDNRSDSERELQFYSHSLHYLSIASGCHVQLEDWMVTSYDVDFGPEIGSGGLGSWNKTEVALKVLMNEGGVTPNTAVRFSVEDIPLNSKSP